MSQASLRWVCFETSAMVYDSSGELLLQECPCSTHGRRTNEARGGYKDDRRGPAASLHIPRATNPSRSNDSFGPSASSIIRVLPVPVAPHNCRKARRASSARSNPVCTNSPTRPDSLRELSNPSNLTETETRSASLRSTPLHCAALRSALLRFARSLW